MLGGVCPWARYTVAGSGPLPELAGQRRRPLAPADHYPCQLRHRIGHHA
jgi:hypothetical protein